MSTRCAIVVRQRSRYGLDDMETEELLRIYRHFDGYPTCAGVYLADALGESFGNGHDHSWALAFIAALFRMGENDYEIDPQGSVHGDIEYLYAVDGYVDYIDHAEGASKCRITCWRTGWVNGNYDEIMSREPLFSGSPGDWHDMYRISADA